MSAERDYILKETREIGKTLDLIEPLLAKAALDQYESIALGTLPRNLYTGIENIFRCRLETLGVQPARTENWHKDLLQAALNEALIEPSEFPVFRDLLLYRHRHVHGYGHMLDAQGGSGSWLGRFRPSSARTLAGRRASTPDSSRCRPEKAKRLR